MKNIINNNCSNNNQINNTMEVKTMKQLNVNTINKVINSENNSVIASTIGFAGIGNDGFLFNTINNVEQISAYLLLCEANNFEAPDNGIEGFARLAQVYCNTAPDKFGCVGVEKCGYYLNPECYEEAYHFELKGWDINCYISEFGEVLPIKRLTNEDYGQIAAYAKQISSKQPEALRVSDDQIDAYIANAKLEG